MSFTTRPNKFLTHEEIEMKSLEACMICNAHFGQPVQIKGNIVLVAR